jgi:Flp pilus assembly protein TadD
MRLVVISLLAGGLLLAGSVACQNPPQTANPGNLPGRDGNGIQPRLDASTYFAHGHLLERQGNLERAVEQYRQALVVLADYPAARNRLGITLNKLGRHTEATAEFRQAVASQPDQAYLHNNLGFSLFLEGRFAEAEPSFRRALEIQPDFARARMNLGLALARQGSYTAALAEFRQVGSEADAHYNIAMVQVDAGQYAEAVRSLDQALTLDPSMESARQHMRSIARLAAEQEAEREAAQAAAPTIVSAAASTPPPPTTATTTSSAVTVVIPDPVAEPQHLIPDTPATPPAGLTGHAAEVAASEPLQSTNATSPATASTAAPAIDTPAIDATALRAEVEARIASTAVRVSNIITEPQPSPTALEEQAEISVLIERAVTRVRPLGAWWRDVQSWAMQAAEVQTH